MDWSLAALEPLVGICEGAALEGKYVPDPLVPCDVRVSLEVFKLYRQRWRRGKEQKTGFPKKMLPPPLPSAKPPHRRSGGSSSAKK